MKTIDITIFGHVVQCPDLPEYGKFYRKLRVGAWEPHTFATLRENLDASTAYVNIGGWIGVMPFWASRFAKRVVIVEPDPRCRQILAELAPAYPNVTVIEGALSPNSSLKLHAVSEFGSSESSALDIGDGASTTVPGLSVDEIMRHAGPGPVFVKIDVEGYEYRIISEIARFSRYQVRGIQCAVHPALYERALSGSHMWRRLHTAALTFSLGRLFAPRLEGPYISGFHSLTAYLVQGVLLRKVPTGKDFLFLRRTLPAPQRRPPPWS